MNLRVLECLSLLDLILTITTMTDPELVDHAAKWETQWKDMQHSDDLWTARFAQFYGISIGILLTGIHLYFFHTQESFGHHRVSPMFLCIAHGVTVLTCIALALYVVFPKLQEESECIVLLAVGCAAHTTLWLFYTFYLHGIATLRLPQTLVAFWLPILGILTVHVIQNNRLVKSSMTELGTLFPQSESHMKSA